jgi:hypothetical protein
MYMVGRDHVIEDAKTEALLSLKNPAQVAPSIARKLKVLDQSFWFERLELSEAVERLERFERAEYLFGAEPLTASTTPAAGRRWLR